MEGLFQAALEAVAHAGDEGLAVTELWNLLEQPAKELGLVPLLPRLHEPIWKQMLSHSGDLSFKVPSSRELNPSTSPQLATAAAAEAASVKIAASTDLQDASAGVYGRRLLRFTLSDVQRRVLSLLSAARHRGMLQNELAVKVKVQPNNFFYVIKGLEERGLVVKRQAVMRQNKAGARGGPSGATVSTNIVHLVKYAPLGLGETSRVTDGRSSNMTGGVPLLPPPVPPPVPAAAAGGSEPAWQSDDENEGTAEDEGTAAGTSAGAGGSNTSSFQVVDDDAMLLRITSQLAALENSTALERDLKAALGFTSVTGHRQWRRLRGLLLRKGCIQQFLGYHAGDKVSSFVRLEKPWAPEGAWAADGDMDPTLRAILDPFGRMETRGRKVAELTIDRQVLSMIAAAGEAGVTSHEVDTALRLNMKRNSARLDDLQDRFAKAGKDFKVYETAINQGRSILKRYNATPALANALAGQLEGEGAAPRAPDAGWTAEVLDAAAAGLDANEIAEVIGGASLDPGGELPVPGGAGGDNNESEHETESEDEGRQRQHRKNKKAKQQPTASGAGGERKKVTTEIGRLRRQWLVEKVLQEGMLLSSEIGRYLQTAERAAGNLTAVMPDRKVFQRVIDAAVAAGEITTLQVSMPGVHGSLEQRQVSVIARPGTSLEQPGFVDAVFERNRDLQKRVRNVTHFRRKAQQAEAAGVTIPTVEVQPLPRLAEHGAALKEARFKLLLSNGYVSARMVRVRLLHDATWRYVSSRGGPSTAMDPSILEAAESGRAFLVGRSPADAGGGGGAGQASSSSSAILSSSSRPDIGVFSATPEQTALVVTADELWRGMTVGTFLTCLGSRCEDAAAVAQMSHKKDKALGSLTAKELEILAGGPAALVQARSQITRLFDILHRMGLVSAIVPFGANVVGVASSLQGDNAAAYLLRPTAHYEEPQEIQGSAAAHNSQQESGDGDGDGAAEDAEDAASQQSRAHTRRLLHFDVSSDRGREAYWLSMQFMVMCSPAAAAARVRSSDAPSQVLECFPFKYAREAASDRSWVERNGCTGAQIQAVRPLLKRQAPNGASAAAEMTWERAQLMSRQLEVPFEAVARALTIQRGLESGRSSGQKSHRLGGLGRRIGSGGVLMRRSRRQRAVDEEEEEEEDYGELENLEIDVAGHRGTSRLPPERKRKWHAEEDRQLLHAWARWLAMQGPDKILRWGFIRDRPPETKGVSCRYRLQTLKRHSEVGPLVMKVRELASGVHSRRVLRDAAVGGRSASAEGGHGSSVVVVVEEETRGGEEPPGAHQKRRRAPAGAANGDDGSVPAAKRSRSAAGDHPFGVENLPHLFEIFDREDAEALKQVCSEIEEVVASAPNRHKARTVRVAHRPRNALSVFGRALGPWSRGPVPGSNSVPGRALSQLRQWARSAASARAVGAVAPAPAVAAAMDLVKSLLHPSTIRDEDSSTALISRFTEQEIKDAFLLLAKLGHVTARARAEATATAVPVLSLSERFTSETEPLFVPGRVFPEANATLLELRRRGVHGGTAFSAAQHGGSPSAGTVAALLSLSTAGTAQLRFEIPQEWHMQILSSTADDDVAKDELMHLLAGVKVKAVLGPDAVAAAAGGVDGAPRTSSSAAAVVKYSTQKQVFYQPSMVAFDAAMRSDAEKACKKAYTSKKLAGGARGMTALLHAVRAAGPDGLTCAACAAALPSNISKKVVSEAIDTLCRYGLAREVAAYDDCRLVASEASQATLAFPPPPPSTIAPQTEAPKLKEVESALAPLHLPAPGTLQPLADVHLRPWVDHHGRLNHSLWEDLARRVVCTAVQCPGIAGDVLLQSARVVNPQERRELLGALCAAGVLKAEMASTHSKTKASPQSVLAACFGDDVENDDSESGDVEDAAAVPFIYGDASLWNNNGGDKGDESWHFFAEPDKCWQLAGVHPPQVILGN